MNTPIKLKIALQELPHKCERTLLVSRNINMEQLHYIIQVAFGWENAHLFEFRNAKRQASIRVGIPDDFDMDFGGVKTLKAHRVKLEKTFVIENEAKPLWYNYDFGDDWLHRISFLKTTKKDLEIFEGKPICTKAIGKCPPEDVGGPWGYVDFLETLKDEDHPEHEELKEWYGIEGDEDYDEIKVNLQDINKLLKTAI
ncbi:MAG: plasmid pRiA4b ORF-3 family protein [Psychroflexus sp.]